MGRFINPFTDTGFKILFGQELSKPLLIDFLNNLLAGKDKVVDLKFLDKERQRIFKDDRGLIYDIYCDTDDGRKIIVEMQNKSQKYFIERSIYYTSQAVSRQGQKGDWDYNFDAVYFVAFMNFKVDSLSEFRTDVQLLNIKTHKPVSEKVKLIYLQLPCFTKEENECKTDFERWIYIFKNMEILERIPWAAKNSIFAKLGEIAEVANLSKLQRRKYDHDLKVYRDSVNILKYAKEEGFTLGEEKGRAEGRAEGAYSALLATAKNMKSKGMSDDVIAEITQLPISEIENL